MAEKRSLAFGFLGEDLGLGRTLKGLAKDSEHAHSSLSKLGKIAVGAGAVAGVTLLTKKVVDFGKNTVDSYTNAAKSAGALQRVLGGTVEDASRLSFAAHESGVSEESFAKSVRLLEKNLGAATKAQVIKTKHTHQEIVTVNRLKDGHIVHVKALKNVTDWTSKVVNVSKGLGFTYKDTHGRMLPMRDILLNVADKFQHMPNGVEKTALALKLFGRAGTDMIPMLNKGREGVAELMKESDKLGTTMSGKDVASVKEYTKQQRHLHAAMEGLKISIGRELFPIFTAWSDSLAKNAPKIVAWVKDHLPGFQREAKKVATFIKTDLEPAVAHFTEGLVDEGGKIAREVGPFFHWLGAHPDLLKQIGKDALIIGGVLKARSFMAGLGLLKSAGGARGLGVAAGAGAAGAAGAPGGAPVPAARGSVVRTAGRGAAGVAVGAIVGQTTTGTGGKAVGTSLGTAATAGFIMGGAPGAIAATVGDAVILGLRRGSMLAANDKEIQGNLGKALSAATSGPVTPLSKENVTGVLRDLEKKDKVLGALGQRHDLTSQKGRDAALADMKKLNMPAHDIERVAGELDQVAKALGQVKMDSLQLVNYQERLVKLGMASAHAANANAKGLALSPSDSRVLQHVRAQPTRPVVARTASRSRTATPADERPRPLTPRPVAPRPAAPDIVDQRLVRLGRESARTGTANAKGLALSPSDSRLLQRLASKPTVINNNTTVIVNGATDTNKVIAEQHRRARVHAVGSVNNAATRDRNG